MGYKKATSLGEYLERFGLDHFEYQCGHGVRISETSARELGGALAEKRVTVSLHTPYFISLSSADEEKRLNSVGYILQSAKILSVMGGDRLVIHSGSCSKMPRNAALELAKGTLKAARAALIEHNLGHIRCCPETMGKINQLGDLDEVLELCAADESFIPCVDFGHLNARTAGGVKGRAGYEAIFSRIGGKLGEERLKTFHSHFSKVEYTEAGGEKKHLTFRDKTYGPDYEPFLELTAKLGLSPVIVCESAGTQTEDAAAMKNYYRGCL
jgi:deoxyribonuclease-4